MNHKCTPLRSLALKAAYGEISHDAYRQARRKLLTAITEGELAPEELTHNTASFKLKNPSRINKRGFFVVLLVAAIGAVVTLYLTRPELLTQTGYMGEHTPSTASEEDGELVLYSPLERSMHRLLESKRWNRDDISHFLAIWRSLDNDERARQRTTLSFKKLRDRTTMKVNEMEALSGAQGSMANSEILLELRRLDSALR